MSSSAVGVGSDMTGSTVCASSDAERFGEDEDGAASIDCDLCRLRPADGWLASGVSVCELVGGDDVWMPFMVFWRERAVTMGKGNKGDLVDE